METGNAEDIGLGVDKPQSSTSKGIWASDVIAETLRALEIPYAALNPGASFRGLHDSIVNHLGNQNPQMILCLHEEHAVAIAHGWAKIRETPMAAIVHSNVGLMHATMAVFNAWCDRVPLLLIGATGPVDAAKRRPWIDWIHTSADQGALVRNYTKWDNQPSSVESAVEALLRANLISRTAPQGPTYVCLDAGLQEVKLDERPVSPAIHRYQPADLIPLSPDSLTAVTELLASASKPLILCGRGGRSMDAWMRRIALAEMLAAPVLTDLKTAATFPNVHRLHAASAGIYINEQSAALLREADVILSLDWVDLGGTIKTAYGNLACEAKIIHSSLDQHLHNGWSMDHQILPAIDHYFMADPDIMVASLLEACKRRGIPTDRSSWFEPVANSPLKIDLGDGDIGVDVMAQELRRATTGTKITLVRVPSSWAGNFWPVQHPLDFLGYDGGGGLASGPGLHVGAALALHGSARVPVTILGDGDFLMGNTALWTAAHCGLAGLVVVANNRSYFNDEIHQERVAGERGRNVSNKWIGQRISAPDIDVAGLARAQGCDGFGPVLQQADLHSVFSAALTAVRGGRTVVVDVRVRSSGPVAVARAQSRG